MRAIIRNGLDGKQQSKQQEYDSYSVELETGTY